MESLHKLFLSKLKALVGLTLEVNHVFCCFPLIPTVVAFTALSMTTPESCFPAWLLSSAMQLVKPMHLLGLAPCLFVKLASPTERMAAVMLEEPPNDVSTNAGGKRFSSLLQSGG